MIIIEQSKIKCCFCFFYFVMIFLFLKFISNIKIKDSNLIDLKTIENFGV